LTVNTDNYSITVKDKKTNRVSTLTLVRAGDKSINDLQGSARISANKVQWDNAATDLDIAITPCNSRVNFDWIVKSQNAPHEVEFTIQDGGIPIVFQGFDADGQMVEVIAEKTGDRIVERIEKGGKYSKTINPEFQVGSSSDVGYVTDAGHGTDYVAGSYIYVGRNYWTYYSLYYHLHTWARWTGFSIPSGSTINSNSYVSYMSFSDWIIDGGTLTTRVYFDDQSSPSAPTSASNYLGRTLTSNYTAWNISTWTADTWQNSSSIQNILQELVNSYGTLSTLQALHRDYTANGIPNRDVLSYGYSPTPGYAPKIHIEYTPPPPAAPTNVSATDGTYNDKIQISWTASSGASGYRIYRNTVNNSGTATQIDTDTSSPYDDTAVAVGITYYYWAKAYNDGGDSGFSTGDSGNLLFRKYLGVAITSDFDAIAFGDATNFADILRDEQGWTQYFVSHNPSGTWWQEESSGGTDNDKADYCELTYLGAHGQDNDGAWDVTKIQFPGGYVESNTVKLGYASPDSNGKSIWAFISSCKLLKDTSYTSWKELLQGTHMLLGYKTNAVGSAPDMENLAKRLTGSDGFSKENIQDAYFNNYVDEGMHAPNWCRIIAENDDVADYDWIDYYYPIISVDSTKVIIDCHL
jgi:hypothetical protein